MATSAVTASLFAAHNKHVLMESNKYPIYDTVSYLLGTKCIYEITNVPTTKTQGLAGITPENIVEGMETLNEYATEADDYMSNNPSLVIDDPFAS